MTHADSAHGLPELPAPVGVAVAALLAVFPASLFIQPSLANACHALLSLAGLALLIADSVRRPAAVAALSRRYWPIAAALCTIPLAAALHGLLAPGAQLNLPYLYLRFALFAPIAWLLLRAGPARLAPLQWGLAVGAIISAAWIATLAQGGRPMHVGEANVIPFGNLSLLMGLLAFACAAWSPAPSRLRLAVGLAAAMAGLYVSLLSETRGGWLAIPILIPLAAAAWYRPRGRHLLLGSASAVVALALVASASDRVQARMADALASIRQGGLAGTGDSSIGTRVELWQAALDMLASHPLTGVGLQGFQPALQAMAADGRLSGAALALDHAHNDALHLAATLGLPGLLAVLATWLVPALFFGRRLRHHERPLRAAAATGLLLCTGFILFGLSESMLVIKLTNAFYSLLLAACVAFIASRESKPR